MPDICGMTASDSRRSNRAYRPSTRERSRSRSPHRDGPEEHSRKRRRKRSPHGKPKVKNLPFKAKSLSKHDFTRERELFRLYLDVQKEKELAALDEKEARGRWKSFVGKWNRGELAEGWYDPDTKKRAYEAAVFEDATFLEDHNVATSGRSERAAPGSSEGDSDEDFGPTMPSGHRRHDKAGPSVPNTQDLELAQELREESQNAARADLAYHRKADRNDQKARLEELVPRADAGSFERKLEKKREVTDGNAGFRAAKEGGDLEIPDSDLMGDSVDDLKKRKMEMERKKTEKELRKEERLRAREAEREERLQKVREKEEKTMEYLRALAKERFG